jgi:putative phosphoesterase
MSPLKEPARARRILVLADTHNHLPANLESLAKGADEIWHLGDVCAPSLLEEIRAIGLPVVIVCGNCDSNSEWPLVVDLERNRLRFRLQHIPPARTPADVDVLLHGHTHVPRNERRDGVLFLNPGCVTRPNRGAPASAATLEISDEGKLNWNLVPLR